jgi:protein PhnA
MGSLLVCPECGHEWAGGTRPAAEEAGPGLIRDAVGNVLSDGDTVTVVKDLKIKGSSDVIKVGTKVRGIRLVDGVADHDIDCKVDGVGRMQLKSSVVKKV